MKRSRMPPSRRRKAAGPICFEITETAVIDHPTLALRNIELFAEKGISISIDDYGSGLSSLAYLRQLPAHELKIDKDVHREFDARPARCAAGALLDRSGARPRHERDGRRRRTAAALALLAAMGCDTAQGFVIAAPRRLRTCRRCLRRTRPTSRQGCGTAMGLRTSVS